MNNEPNSKHHAINDLVIHDDDLKADSMLMRVTGYTPDGLVKTKYVDPDRGGKEYVNDIKFLHDPQRPDVRARWKITVDFDALKVWLLELREHPNYDEVESFVIIAENEAQARKLASERCGDEGARAWLYDEFSECTVLVPTSPPRVVVRNFRSG